MDMRLRSIAAWALRHAGHAPSPSTPDSVAPHRSHFTEFAMRAPLDGHSRSVHRRPIVSKCPIRQYKQYLSQKRAKLDNLPEAICGAGRFISEVTTWQTPW